ncbi:MAG: hypothetical protein UZ01_03109 [Candidatus Brocadia sinica]|nr:MAG: hypothetical protein UZ01_03109 [Candidatus Brocadia sinica]
MANICAKITPKFSEVDIFVSLSEIIKLYIPCKIDKLAFTIALLFKGNAKLRGILFARMSCISLIFLKIASTLIQCSDIFFQKTKLL